MNETATVKKQGRMRQTDEKIKTKYIFLMRTKNWEKITVKELCEETDISRGTFYQHFEGIYDVMEQIQVSLLAKLETCLQKSKPIPVANKVKLLENFDNCFDMSIPMLFRIWYSFCEEYREEFLSLCHPDNGDLCFPMRVKALLRPHLDAMMDRDGLPRDTYRENFHNYFFDLLYNAIYGWLNGEGITEMTADMMAETVNATRIGACYSYYKKRLAEEEKRI